MADRRFTDLELERQLAGDLPADREFETTATDADRARLAELRAEHEAFLRGVDVDLEVRRIQQRVARAAPEPASRRWWRWLVPAGAFAVAAAVLLVVFRGGDSPSSPDDIQVKGDDITLVIHVQTGASSRRLASGDDVVPGDRLRFEINAAKRGYVAIVGIDGSGALTVYHPDAGTAPLVFDPTMRILPGAIALDRTPGDERFFAFYSEQPFEVSTVVAAIEQNQPLPPHISKAEVVLHKKLPP